MTEHRGIGAASGLGGVPVAVNMANLVDQDTLPLARQPLITLGFLAGHLAAQRLLFVKNIFKNLQDRSTGEASYM